ncbi:hypothetical protein ICL81_05585 [Leucobacter sp. cx-328]|uniref:hypothetical protein n=1 Tax=unclassified Leucobacter TaxID=2621730 RepID=UPI00165DE1D6|nr:MULTISPECIES: hypothetical protein [unclassified Leucobacter]MBC9943987.1 hypothetical protein [Leucobacter sp. cx-328]
MLRCPAVLLEHVFAEVKRQGEYLLTLVSTGLVACQFPLDLGQFGVELLLFAAEQVYRDGVVVMCLKQLLLFALQLQLRLFQLFPFVVLGASHLPEGCSQQGFHLEPEERVERDAPLQIRNEVFQVRDLD